MIKKYHIEVIIVNDRTREELMNDLYQVISTNNIIGYSIQKNEKHKRFGQIPEKLQLFCLKSTNNSCDIIADIIDDIYKVKMEGGIKYKNPPIENWLANHKSWINKEVNRFMSKYSLPKEEVYGEMYMSALSAYNANKYLLNLNYIKKMFYNNIFAKFRKEQKIPQTVSFDEKIGNDDEGLTLLETIANDEPELGSSIEYALLEKSARKILQSNFNDREITMIMNGLAKETIDKNLYTRLRNWRTKHTIGELYNVMEKIK